MWESTIVILAVLTAAAFAGRAAWRAITRKGSSCASCGIPDCPSRKGGGR